MNLGMRTSTARPFTPLSLFAASEPGAWYDPSDMSTMFQDFNGATPVTAVEQPVSVILDKSKNGVGTNGTRRLNVVLYSEQFNNAYWFKVACTAPNATTIQDTATTNFHYVNSGGNGTGNTSFVSGVSYVLRARLEKGTIGFGGIHINDGTPRGCSINLTTGQLGTPYGGATASAIADGSGWVLTITVTAGSTTSTGHVAVYLSNSNSLTSYTGTGTGTIFVEKIDLRLAADANVAPTYQPVTDTWYNVQAGNHAYTPSTATASRPVLSARYNLLTKTEQFDDAAWSKVACTAVNTTAVTDPLGGTTADKVVNGSGGTSTTSYFDVAASGLAVNTNYSLSIYARSAELSMIALAADSFNDGWSGAGQRIWFNLSNGTVSGSPSVAGATGTITNVGNGWYRCVLTFKSFSTGNGRARFFLASSNGNINTTQNSSGIYAWGADLRVANDGVALPVYQRVNTSTDYDTTNFPMYLRFDGSDDYMLTGTITPGVDKAQVFAGVRKLSDAAIQCLYELSSGVASNNGSLAALPSYDGGAGTGAFWTVASKGTVLSVAASANTFSAPQTVVQTAQSDIANDVLTLRLNSVQRATSSTDQGTGNFLAYPLYIGRRNAASIPLNGRLYGMIVRFGANLTDTQITNTETWLNARTKAY